MTAALDERAVPEDLWTLLQRVLPPAPVCLRGRGHRQQGEREGLAAMIFVATPGCTRSQPPLGFVFSAVTVFHRFTEWTEPSWIGWSTEDSWGAYE
ncbi:hypothetical protein ACLVWQ_20530 [Streptomyces sp. CWNU-52B]|uniref:hypothetical protein n=1 Tax=unclassified Streptomyces TaxID=2593676 RepID=UPI0039C1BD04